MTFSRSSARWWPLLFERKSAEDSSPLWEAIEALRLAKARLFPREAPRVFTSREEAIGFGTSNVKAKLMEDIQSVINLCDELKGLLSNVSIENNEGRIIRQRIIGDMDQIREGMEKLLETIEKELVDVSAEDLLFVEFWTSGGEGKGLHTLQEGISTLVRYVADEGTAANLKNKGQELVQALTSIGRLYRFYMTLLRVREGVGHPRHEDKRLETIFASGWGLKSRIIDDIREVLELMDDFEKSVNEVQVSAENKFGQSVKNELIDAVREAKRAMANAFNELVGEEGLVKLSKQTEANFRKWTGRAPGGLSHIFTTGVSNFIHFCKVEDESKKKELKDKGYEIFVILNRLDFWYDNYEKACSIYEEYKAQSKGGAR